jgi:subtilisin family serine protease
MPSAFIRARRVAALLALGLLPTLTPVATALESRPVTLTPAAHTVEGVVLGAGVPGALPGRYIVVLRPGLLASAQGLVGAAQVARTFPAIAAFSARLSAAQARRLAASPAVAFVEQDRTVRMESTVQHGPSWNLDRIDQRSRTLSRTYRPGADGSSVHAYVIDSGIRTSHVEFGGRASRGADFVDGTHRDCNGHGTHVAGTIGGTRYGVAKKVRLVAVRVLNCAGAGTIEGVLNGVNWVTKHAIKPAVANMSLGADRSRALDYAVARSIASGVTYAVAAGNENQNATYSSPAAVPAAITVAATDAHDRRAGFSNFGSLVDLFAPGVSIWSAYSSSNTTIARMSGTSMASPAVAGAAALVLDANPGWSPRTVRDYLVRHATSKRVTRLGRGSPNRLLYLTAPPAAPVIATRTLPAATEGVAYHAAFALAAARRGTWRVTSGTLPDGLSFTAAGKLSGTPMTAGAWTFTVGFTDYVPTPASRSVTLTVGTPPASGVAGQAG